MHEIFYEISSPSILFFAFVSNLYDKFYWISFPIGLPVKIDQEYMNEMFSFVEFVTFPPTRFTKKSSVILPSSSVIWQINNVAIKNWPKFVIHEKFSNIFQEI